MAESNNTAFEVLKDYLKNTCGAKIASGGKEIVKRCHICGDSSDLSDAHMYIGVRNGRIVYNCFKCNASGLVDAKFLRDIGCYNTDLIGQVKEQNKSAGSSSSNSINRIYRRKELKNGVINYDLAYKKLEYLNWRLGTFFTIETAMQFNIILNIGDFLDINNFTQYTRADAVMIDLHDYYIGFMTSTKDKIIMRRIVGKGKGVNQNWDRRYINYSIYNNKLDNSNAFYFVPSVVDTLSNDPVQIHITEGTLDILGVYFNTGIQDKRNKIFVCSSGKNYAVSLFYLLKNFGFMNLEIHIYPDNDVDDKVINREIAQVTTLGFPIYIHRNIYPDEKDFGVPIHRIQQQIRLPNGKYTKPILSGSEYFKDPNLIYPLE